MDKNYEHCQFGRGYAYKLINTHIKTILLDKLEKYYRLKLFVPFGKTYQTIKSQEDLDDVVAYQHLVNFRIDRGISYLYLTEYNGVRLCYYIIGTDYHNCNIYSTMQRFRSDLFTSETLMEGYLIDDAQTFLVEDLVVVDGHTLRSGGLEDRIKRLNNILDYNHCADPVLDNYDIILKDYVEYTYIQSFATDYLFTLPYRNHVTGLMFSPLGNCVVHLVMAMSVTDQPKWVSNTEDDRMKVVQSPRCTQACFIVKTTDKPDVYHLYLSSPAKGITYYDIASIPDRKSSAYIKGLFTKGITELVMVCKYDDRAHIKRWQPVLVSNRRTPDTIYKLC